MTRTEKLTSMRMAELVKVAEDLGIKINPEASKTIAIEKILKAEAEKSVELEPENNQDMILAEDLETALTIKAESKEDKKSGIKSRITITYNGCTKTPKEWGESLGLDPKYIRSQLRKGKSPEEILGGTKNE